LVVAVAAAAVVTKHLYHKTKYPGMEIGVKCLQPRCDTLFYVSVC